MYATLRNSNEGMNGFIKDGEREAVDDPERRRIRGRLTKSLTTWAPQAPPGVAASTEDASGDPDPPLTA
jgi:hypothetical protein